MPYDGIVMSAVVYELSGLLNNGRIDKIIQTESDEVLLGCYAHGENYKLLLSANASNPRMHLTRQKKESPLTAPPFCMVLRKHIQGGRITEISQSGFDRVVTFTIEHPNEMGDYGIKKLVIEIMGKHSNIFLLGENGTIFDAIKHVDSSMNSYRELMPARPYVAPPPQDKIVPTDETALRTLCSRTESENTAGKRIDKYLLENISGFSPLLCRSICEDAGLAPETKGPLSAEQSAALCNSLLRVCEEITAHNYRSEILLEQNANPYLPPMPKDMHCLSVVRGTEVKYFNTVNLMLDEFYATVDYNDRLVQKKSNVSKNLTLALDRCRRKLAEQENTIADAADYDDYRIKGELLTANLYKIKPGMKSVTVTDYYQTPPAETEIALDENKAPEKCAQQYFKTYHKKKSSHENAARQVLETREEIQYLENVRQMLEICTQPNEIAEIRQELREQGYIKFDGVSRKGEKKPRPGKQKKPQAPELSRPMKFRSSDGFEIWVGKNNKQNDHLTLKTASGADLWLHTKSFPGSHVIIRAASVPGGKISETAILEAAGLAAWYSGARNTSNAEVDYTEIKNVKKPAGAKPGMVNYFRYRTVRVRPLPFCR